MKEKELDFNKYTNQQNSNTFFYKIGIIGPARVGKTSIISTLLDQAKDALAQTGVSIKPFEEKDEKGNLMSKTKDKIERTKSAIDSGLKFGEFEPTERATISPFIFDLAMTITRQNQSNEPSKMRFAMLDYPGNLLFDNKKSESQRDKYEKCKAWIHDSSVIIVPIDSNLVMEVEKKEHYEASQELLQVREVEELVRDWAKARWEKQESGLLLLVPVKCETYFDDNGGTEDKSEELYQEIKEFYEDIINAAEKEMKEKEQPTSNSATGNSYTLTEMLSMIFGIKSPKKPTYSIEYHPVDTIGCIELKNAKWEKYQDGKLFLDCEYIIRNPTTSKPKRKPLGADGIIYSIFQQIIENRQSSGIFPRLWDWLGGSNEVLAYAIYKLSQKPRVSRFKQIKKGNVGEKDKNL